jgi:hypothetical protein
MKIQPIFSRNEDHNKIAFMNWRMSQDSTIRYFMTLADGYLSSAIILAKQCLISNRDKQADILIFPILTNANHGIELYLKAMIWSLNQMLDSDLKIEGKHNISQMYKMVKSKINVLGGQSELKAFEEGMTELESYLEELTIRIEATSKKDKMDFSRYPVSTDYENHFYVDRFGNVEVDLENFVRRFEVISDKLGQLAEYFYEESGDEESGE